MEMLFMNSQAYEVQPLWMEVLFVSSWTYEVQALWMEMLFVNSWTYEVQPLWMEVPQVVAFSSIVDLLKAMYLTLQVHYDLKSLDHNRLCELSSH